MSYSTTVCPRLWDHAHIDVAGEVHFCCRRGPVTLGTIQTTSLDKIWHGEAARQVRKASVEGALHCQRTCNLLSKAEKTTSCEEARGWTPRLRKVHLEHHEFCNIACIMCYQLNLEKRRILPNDLLFERIDFDKVHEVQIQGGEPLAHKQCRLLIHKLIDERGVPVTLQTNGLLITAPLAERLAASCLEIMIALNAATRETHERVNRGSSLERVLQSVRLLQKARDRFQSRFRIEAQMTLIRENVHELSEFIRFAERQGFDSIAVSWEESIPDYLSAHPDLFLRLHESLRERLASPLFIKAKHKERLAVLFDLESDHPRVRHETLPALEPTLFYRDRWPEDKNSLANPAAQEIRND